MLGAGCSIKKKLKIPRTAQLRIIFTVLYLCGLRLNEVKMLTKKDFILAMQIGEFSIVHSKTNTCQKHIVPEIGKKILQTLQPFFKLLPTKEPHV
jgi:site-specific recombinase XerC